MDIMQSTQVSCTLSAIGIWSIISVIFISWNILVINACLQLLITAFDDTHRSPLLRLSCIVKQLKTFLTMNFDHIAGFTLAYAAVNLIQDGIHKLEIAEGTAKVVGLYFLYSFGNSTEVLMKMLVVCKCIWWIVMEVYLDVSCRDGMDSIGINGKVLDLYSLLYHF